MIFLKLHLSIIFFCACILPFSFTFLRRKQEILFLLVQALDTMRIACMESGWYWLAGFSASQVVVQYISIYPDSYLPFNLLFILFIDPVFSQFIDIKIQSLFSRLAAPPTVLSFLLVWVAPSRRSATKFHSAVGGQDQKIFTFCF